jgi:hypothetical protein
MSSLTWLDTILFYFLDIWNSDLERMSKNKESESYSSADSFIIVLAIYVHTFIYHRDKPRI